MKELLKVTIHFNNFLVVQNGGGSQRNVMPLVNNNHVWNDLES